MALTEAQKRAINKYNKESIERTTIRLPKGTRKRIENVGAKSMNSYIVNAIQERLTLDEANQAIDKPSTKL